MNIGDYGLRVEKELRHIGGKERHNSYHLLNIAYHGVHIGFFNRDCFYPHVNFGSLRTISFKNTIGEKEINEILKKYRQSLVD